jgi:hypothetical protein
MSAMFRRLVRGRGLELALALALGYALITLARALADVAMNTLAQNGGHDPQIDERFLFNGGIYLLTFDIGGTIVFYGAILSAALALALLGCFGLFVVRARDRQLGACPSCGSRIPHESRHCAYCGSAIGPIES